MVTKVILRVCLVFFSLLPFAGSAEELCKVALLGDSMTWLGGDKFDNPKGWTYYMKGYPVEMHSYARSGATWTNTATTRHDTEAVSEVLDSQNVIYNQVERLKADSLFSPDKIIIFCGTNDAWFADRRPGIFSPFSIPELRKPAEEAPSDYTSLAASVFLDCSLLKESFPNTEIIVVTPPEGAKFPLEKLQKVADIIEDTASKLDIKVARGDRLIPIRAEREKGQRKQYTYDGIHTNEAGARKIAECMIGLLDN